MDTQKLDVSAALTNPSKFFEKPQDVLVHPGLSRDTKLEILRQWEVDARLLQVAEEENMTDGESSHLGSIVCALIALDDENKGPGADKATNPSKQGGN